MTIHDSSNQLVRRLRTIDPRAVDGALALAFTVAALATLAARTGAHAVFRDDDALSIVLVLAQTLPLAARRAAPLPALAISVAAISLHVAIGYEGVAAGTFAAMVILYSAASGSGVRGQLLAAALTAAGIAIYFTTSRDHLGLPEAFTTSATYVAAWGIGVYARSRRQYIAVVEEHAALLEREADAESRAAIAAERARIARELHDIVGHALNVIVIQAGGAQRVFDARPDLVRETLSGIEASGRQALVETERMLGILHEPEAAAASLGPQPGLAQLQTLAKQVSDAGLPVDVRIEGSPVTLAPGIDLSAYRIVQEALTNALKHAGPARACVRVHYGPGNVELEISDDGKSSRNAASGAGAGGRGLIGMRERVAVFGGQLTVGLAPGGGFRVHATLPTGVKPE
jgi:signal transduction histidine kinase